MVSVKKLKKRGSRFYLYFRDDTKQHELYEVCLFSNKPSQFLIEMFYQLIALKVAEFLEKYYK